MTALTVLYARRTRLPLAALTTTVTGNLPALDPSATVRLSPPVAVAQKPGTAPPPPPPKPGLPRTLTIPAADLAIAAVEAEFDDPLEVFGWQVVITTAPDGTTHYRLDQLAVPLVAADLDTATHQLKLEVPQLGNLPQLNFDVYGAAGQVGSGCLTFSSNNPKPATISLSVPGQSPPVILVEGYPLALALADGLEPSWP
jgi:hypothetical protein